MSCLQARQHQSVRGRNKRHILSNWLVCATSLMNQGITGFGDCHPCSLVLLLDGINPVMGQQMLGWMTPVVVCAVVCHPAAGLQVPVLSKCSKAYHKPA